MGTNSKRFKVSLYFNLTYACNSACVFCGSDSPHVKKRKDIPISTIIDAFDRYNLGKDDEVILNGGEPTIYPFLKEAISAAAQREAKVILFTNGRLIKDVDRAVNLLNAGVFRLSVPIHGSNAQTHDSLTKRHGSFAQTSRGIANAFRIKAKTGFPAQIELKLLALRQSINEWPDAVEYMVRELGIPDTLILSGLHMWSTAATNYDFHTPSLKQLSAAVSSTLVQANHYGIRVQFWSIPHCLMPESYRNSLIPDSISASGVQPRTRQIYFDPALPEGIVVSDEEPDDDHPSHAICSQCDMLSACGPGSVFYRQLRSSACR